MERESAADDAGQSAADDAPPPTLLDLPEDCLPRLLPDERDLLAYASTCTRAHAMCRADSLWQIICMRRWPHLGLAHSLPPDQGWRALHRERAAMPEWRSLVAHLDHATAITGADPDGTACAWAEALVPALLAIGAARAEHGLRLLRCVEWQQCVSRLASQLCSGPRRAAPRLDHFRAFAASLEVELDKWWEEAAGGYYGGGGSGADAVLSMRSRLLRVLRGRSALQYLNEMIHGRWHDASGMPIYSVTELTPCTVHDLVRGWDGAGLPGALRALDSALESLRLEGCDLSVPRHLRPHGVPQSHDWWLHSAPTNADAC